MFHAAQPGEGASATARLDAALENEGRAEARQNGASGTSDELSAAADLYEAREQVAAREAWVKWLDRGY
jgi:hypothetical protein